LVIKTGKKYVCIPRSSLVINVCKQGKTLCSPCIFCPYSSFLGMISGVRREVDENCFLGYCLASSSNNLQTFRNNLSGPTSRPSPLQTGTIGCPETSARTHHYLLRKSTRRAQFSSFSVFCVDVRTNSAYFPVQYCLDFTGVLIST
jgi:hypothetical protein